jgi:phosphatidylinositol glycan class Q protein
MVARNGLMRIFWPSDAPAGPSPGVLVGFRNSELDAFVVAILQDVELRHVEDGLLTGTLLRHSTHDAQDLLKQCRHSSLRILGYVNPKTPPNGFDPRLLATYTDPPTRFPRIFCPAETDLTLQVIMYERPHPTQMQYISLAPMALALGEKTDARQWDSAFDGVNKGGQKAREQKEKLVEKLKLHTVIAHTATHQDTSLPVIVDQINCSFELDALLQKNVGGIRRRLRRGLSVSERMTESANNLWDYVFFLLGQVWKVCYPLAAQVVIIGAVLHCSASEMILRVLDWRPGSPDSPALKDVSATAQQVDIRLQQSCYWPIQYLTLRKRKENWESITSSHPEYIRFYNSLWLVANDIIIGIALGSYLIENYVFVATQVDTILNVWSIEGLRRIISWLMEWPGGLKLNTELAEFMGDLFLWVIDYWAGVCIKSPQ